MLAYDMVFVPRPPLTRELLGISRTLPRSVPVDLLVALASRVVTGMVVQKLVLVGIIAVAAYGAARLVPEARPAAMIGAGVLYAWNPFVYERLLLGQWALLLGYALLPWTARSAVRLRRGEPGAGWTLVLAVAGAAAASPYTGVFATLLALALLGSPPWPERLRSILRRVGWAALVGVAMNLSWLVPAILQRPVPDRPALAVQMFRARSDSPIGLVGSLLSLGGMWRTDLAPPGRGGYAWLPAFILVAGVAALGWRALGRRWPSGAVIGLLGLSSLGVLLAAAPTVPGLRGVVAWVVGNAPGGGLVRDSQRLVVPLALALSVGFGTGVDELLPRMGVAMATGEPRRPSRGARIVSVLPAVTLAVLPASLAPTLAWGAAGRLSPARYPQSWARAESLMAADPATGAVLVLPWHTYLPFGWNHDRAVHQPALRYFSRPVVADGELKVGSAVLPAEDPWARLADLFVRSPSSLRSALPHLGVRYVLLFKEADWRASLPLAAGLPAALDTADLVLYRSPGSVRQLVFHTPSDGPVVAADATAVLLVLLAAGMIARRRRRAAGSDGNHLAILRSEDRAEPGVG